MLYPGSVSLSWVFVVDLADSVLVVNLKIFVYCWSEMEFAFVHRQCRHTYIQLRSKQGQS